MNLLCSYDKLTGCTDIVEQVDVIYLDFRRAVETLCHSCK